jgi:hypothetical protein
MKSIQVIKQDYLGREVWQYTGTLVEIDDSRIVIEAYFDREDTQIDKMVIRPGDKFIETYYSNQWFNIYEIQDQQSENVKAWYCNISYPAEISKDTVVFRDLVLDLLVYPDGTQVVLDMDEFEALSITDDLRQQALQAQEQLQEIFNNLIPKP